MIHLRGSGTDVVVDVDAGVPVVVHWGAPLGDDVDASGLARARERARPSARAGFARRRSARRGRARARFRVPRPDRVCAATGRAAAAWSPRFRPAGHESGDGRLVVEAVDPVARLRLDHDVRARSRAGRAGGDHERRRRPVHARRAERHAPAARARRRSADVPRAARTRVPAASPAVAERRRARRELARSHVARASTGAVRRHGRVRRVAGRGLGRPPGLERQPRDDRRATARRAAHRPARRAASTPARSPSSRASRTRPPRSSPSTPPTA